MTKPYRFIPLLIVALNALAIAVRWSTLSPMLAAHFNLQGEASGTMPRTMLLLYVVMGVVVCLMAYLIARKKQQLETGLVMLASGICLVFLFSTLVTLTAGTMPIFMLAEPVVLLVAVVGFVVSVVKMRKAKQAK